MESCQSSLSGTMCELSTVSPGGDSLMSCVEGSHAKTLAQQGREPESPDPAPAFGANSKESFAKYDRVSSGWKTPQCSLLEDSELFSQTWPRWGIMQDGECWE